MDFSVIYYIKTSVVGISSIIPMHSSIPVSVIPMLHCIYVYTRGGIFPNKYRKLICFAKKSVKWHSGFLSFKLPIPTVSLQLGPLKGECMNQKAKPHKQSLVIGDRNEKQVLGLYCFVSKDFEYYD